MRTEIENVTKIVFLNSKTGEKCLEIEYPKEFTFENKEDIAENIKSE